MKKHCYILFLILFGFLTFQSKATHLVGSDISYQCTSTSGVYKVVLKIYRDCFGIPLCPNCTNAIPNGTIAGCTTASSGWATQILGASTACNGVSYGNFTLNAITVSNSFDIIQTCVSVTSVCTNCNTRNAGTFSPGIEVYTYEGNIDLSGIPSTCCNITLGANTCCRNNALTTIVPGSFQTVCTINRCQSTCNSSPTFTNEAVAIVCGNTDFVYNLGAMDPDGDSLSYAFGQSLQGIGSFVQYVPPFSATYPFPYFGAPSMNAALPAGLHIDPITGDILFRPIGIFVSNLVIEVTQWKLVGNVRVNVGMTRRDVQFQTQFCNTNKTPIIKVYKNNVLQSGNNFTTKISEQICLDIVAEDQFQLPTSGNGNVTIIADSTDLKWNNPGLYISLMANATFTRNYDLSQRGLYGPKADSFKFCWTPPVNAFRQEPYLFTVSGSDRFCPIIGFAVRGITIKVNNSKMITIDSTTKNIFCKNSLTSTNINYRTSSINLVPNNVFTIQLSDSLGSFTNATIIGTKSTTDINGFIPVSYSFNLATNSNYKIRLVCSSDTTKSLPYNISIANNPTIGTITGDANPNSISNAFSYSVSSQPNISYSWSLLNGNVQSGLGTNSINVVWTNIGTGNVKAKITNNNGCKDSTNLAVNITAVGIHNLSLENDLKVYPNPTKTSITITNKTNLVGKKYIITNLVGQTVLNGKLNIDETIVNLENLQSGVYLLSIDGLNKQSIKVVKE